MEDCIFVIAARQVPEPRGPPLAMVGAAGISSACV
jgi:hypothetical protein